MNNNIDEIFSNYINCIYSNKYDNSMLEEIYMSNEKEVDDLLYISNLIDGDGVFLKTNKSKDTIYFDFNKLVEKKLFNKLYTCIEYKCLFDNKIWIDAASMYYYNKKLYKTAYAISRFKFSEYKEFYSNIVEKTNDSIVNYSFNYSLKPIQDFYFNYTKKDNVFSSDYIKYINDSNYQFRYAINYSDFLIKKLKTYKLESFEKSLIWINLLYNYNENSKHTKKYTSRVKKEIYSNWSKIKNDIYINSAINILSEKENNYNKNELIYDSFKELFEKDYNIHITKN